jgi:hypothetical protein
VRGSLRLLSPPQHCGPSSTKGRHRDKGVSFWLAGAHLGFSRWGLQLMKDLGAPAVSTSVPSTTAMANLWRAGARTGCTFRQMFRCASFGLLRSTIWKPRASSSTRHASRSVHSTKNCAKIAMAQWTSTLDQNRLPVRLLTGFTPPLEKSGSRGFECMAQKKRSWIRVGDCRTSKGLADSRGMSALGHKRTFPESLSYARFTPEGGHRSRRQFH